MSNKDKKFSYEDIMNSGPLFAKFSDYEVAVVDPFVEVSLYNQYYADPSISSDMDYECARKWCGNRIMIIDDMGCMVDSTVTSYIPYFSNVGARELNSFDFLRSALWMSHVETLPLQVSSGELCDEEQFSTLIREFFGIEGIRVIQITDKGVIIGTDSIVVHISGIHLDLVSYFSKYWPLRQDVPTLTRPLVNSDQVRALIFSLTGTDVQGLSRVLRYKNINVSGSSYDIDRAKYFEQLGDAVLESYTVWKFRKLFTSNGDYARFSSKLLSNNNFASIMFKSGLSAYYLARRANIKDLADVFEVIVGLYVVQCNYDMKLLDVFLMGLGFDFISFDHCDVVEMLKDNSDIVTNYWLSDSVAISNSLGVTANSSMVHSDIVLPISKEMSSTSMELGDNGWSIARLILSLSGQDDKEFNYWILHAKSRYSSEFIDSVKVFRSIFVVKGKVRLLANSKVDRGQQTDKIVNVELDAVGFVEQSSLVSSDIRKDNDVSYVYVTNISRATLSFNGSHAAYVNNARTTFLLIDLEFREAPSGWNGMNNLYEVVLEFSCGGVLYTLCVKDALRLKTARQLIYTQAYSLLNGQGSIWV